MHSASNASRFFMLLSTCPGTIIFLRDINCTLNFLQHLLWCVSLVHGSMYESVLTNHRVRNCTTVMYYTIVCLGKVIYWCATSIGAAAVCSDVGNAAVGVRQGGTHGDKYHECGGKQVFRCSANVHV